MVVQEMIALLSTLDSQVELYVSDADTFAFLPCTGVSLYRTKNGGTIGAVESAGYSDGLLNMSDVTPI